MRQLRRIVPLLLCLTLLFSLAPSVFALPPANLYAETKATPDVYLLRDADFSQFLDAAAEDALLYLGGDDAGDGDYFAIVWDEAAFAAGIASGTDSFSVTGVYQPIFDWWSEERIDHWHAGDTALSSAAVPSVSVRLRPAGAITHYTRTDPIDDLFVFRSTPFESAFSSLSVLMQREAGQSTEQFDPARLLFLVAWNRQEYEAGIASGAASFSVSGVYQGPDSADYDGLVQAVGTPSVTVRIKQKPTAPVSYENPHNDRFGYGYQHAFHTTAAAGIPFEKFTFPNDGQLTQVGEPLFLDFDMPFAVAWDQQALREGLLSGKDSFTVSGAYLPSDDWAPEEKQWWQEGLITVAADTPAPTLTVNLKQDAHWPFSVVMRGAGEGRFTPMFRFYWPNGAEKASYAFSFDRVTWYENTDTRALLGDDCFSEAPLTIACWAGDENGEQITVPEDASIYCKMSFEGSAFSDETKIMQLGPDENGNWEMSDWIDGYQGGGGQGEHERPGKEEETAPELPIPPDAPSTVPLQNFPSPLPLPPDAPAGDNVDTPPGTETTIIPQGPTPTPTKPTGQNAVPGFIPAAVATAILVAAGAGIGVMVNARRKR